MHPSIFSVGVAPECPRQPLLFCEFNGGVQLSVLVDTGSMKSILSLDACQLISDGCIRHSENPPTFRANSSQCLSVTGQPLSSSGLIVAQIVFPGSNYVYEGDFLICDNVVQPLQCILGWDFIVSHHLQLSILGDKYVLVGPHGNTPLTPLPPSATLSPPPILSTGVYANSFPGRNPPLFSQLPKWGPAKVTLQSNFTLPARTECILPCKVPHSYSNQLGMVSAKGEVSTYYVACTVSQASNRHLPIRVMNPSNCPIEFTANQILADFIPVSELVSPSPNHNNTFTVCTAMEGSKELSPETLTELTTAINPNLSPKDKKALLNTLFSFPDVFDNSLGHTSVALHNINTGDSPPIRQYPRRLPYHHRAEVEKQVNDMLSQGVIQPSTSPWSSPIVLVKKKDGSYRFCIDYRKLNSITKVDAHPLPRVDDLLEALNGNAIFSTLDLRSGYWQVGMHPDDCEKTAFSTPGGLYEFLRLPYGLSNAPATFSRAIGVVLSGLTYAECLCYFDDVIIFSKNMTEHCSRLTSVLNRFREHNLRVKASKCSFGADKVVYLGHTVSQEGIHTDPKKIEAIKALPAPSNLESLRSFLGIAGYYRKFIPDFATVSAPLTGLTKKGVKFSWSDQHQHAFQALKHHLCSAPVLAYPNFDRPFLLQTDASDVGLGAILAQHDGNGQERVIAYASYTLSPREQNYSTMEKEALAVVFAVKHFRFYLLGKRFSVITDNNALRWLHSLEPKGRIARWIMDLQEFEFDIQHRPGNANQNADALSRLNHSKPVDIVSPITLSLDTSLLEAQRNDPEISKVIEMKEQGFPKPPPFVWRSNPILRTYWECWEQLFISDGLLTRSLNKYKKFPRHAVVIPNTLVPKVLEGLHNSPAGGHMGITRTIHRARERFFWPKMRTSIINFIQQCIACSQSKYQPHQGNAPLRPIQVSEPFVFWALDYMGPLQETATGNKHILVVMDHFTKWCEAFATKDQKAKTVARVLVSRLFSRFGPPTVIHSDQGKNFDSILMHEVYNMMGLKKTRTTAYHPQCDGLVERQNRTLQGIITNFVSQHSLDWDNWLDQAVFAYNTSVHESTGLSPYEMVFGRPARMPIEVELGVPLQNPSSQSDYTRSLRKAIQLANQVAQKNLVAARERQSKQYDQGHPSWKPFEAGQTVWLARPKKWKFGKKWIGPYKICSQNGVNYVLQPKMGKSIVAHHNQLRFCPVPLDPGLPVQPAVETPGAVFTDSEMAEEQEAQGARGSNARPLHLRQAINPPLRFGDFVSH